MSSARAGAAAEAAGSLPPGYRVTRFYTIARRFPTLIGRMPNGGTLPFGPYTVGQFLVIVGILVGGFRTMPLWGGGRGLVVNGITLGVVTVATVTAMRKVPWHGRGPLPLLRGALFGYSRTGGSYRGKALPLRPPVTVHPHAVIASDAVMEQAYALLAQRCEQAASAQATSTQAAVMHVGARSLRQAPATPKAAAATPKAAAATPRPAVRLSGSGLQRLRDQAAAAS